MSTEFRCEVCDGYGVIGRDVDSPCPRCGGSGLKDSVGSLDSEDQDHLHLDLTLPAGVTERGRKGIVTLPEGIGDGTVLRLRGLGPSGEARRGDLYLHVRAIAPPAPAYVSRFPQPVDCESNVGGARPQGISFSALRGGSFRKFGKRISHHYQRTYIAGTSSQCFFRETRKPR